MKINTLLLYVTVLLTPLFTTSCSLVVHVKDYYNVKSHVLPNIQKPPINTARIVFFRPPQHALNAGWMLNIIDGDKTIGILPINSYFIYDTEPGRHIFGVMSGQLSDFLRADIE